MKKTKQLRSKEDILSQFNFIRNKKQEYFICLSLDSSYNLLARRIVTIGTLDTVLAHPREVFAEPITDRAASIIVAHNHPSGDVHPSSADIKMTHQLSAAGQLLGIPMYDHIIIGHDEHFSFKSHSWL